MKTLATGRFLQLVEADGWEYVERVRATGVVAIAAVTTDQQLVLVEQFRKPVDAPVIELPAGLCGDDDASEALEDAASRELLEETGFACAPEALEFLLLATSSAGLTSEVTTVFGARHVQRVAAGGGVDGENITVHLVPLGDAETWIAQRAASGTLVDAKVYVGLHFARSK